MQSYFFITLSIVLLNVLVTSGRRIEATSHQDSHSEIQSPDGALYNPNPIGGPVSAEIYEIRTQLAFLGSFNSKYWYIERTALNYANAVGNCSMLGMSIARTENQSELNFLFDVTLSTDSVWVGAVLPMQLSSFIFDGTDDEYPPASIRFTPINTFALRLVRAANGLSSLTPVGVTSTNFPLCTIP